MIKKLESGKYKVRVSVFDPKKGYAVNRERTVSGNLAQAKEKEVELRSQLKHSCSFKGFGSVSTFSEAIELYRERLRKKGNLSVHHSRRFDLVQKELGHLALNAVPDHFKQYLLYLERTPPEGRAVRGPASLNRRIEIVRAVFNHLVRMEILDKNPISENRFPKLKEKPRDRYLNQDEQLRLLNAIHEHRPYIEPIVRYMLRIPCRISELTEAKRDQYNSFNGTIYIPDSKAGIPIYKPVLEMKPYFDSVPAECPYLFYWIDDKKNYRKFNNIRKPFQFCVKKAGLNNLRVHDLRHIAATELYESGIPEREIMDVAGWKTPMLSTYRHKDSLSTAQKLNRRCNDKSTINLRKAKVLDGI